ncbi:MAG: hypothetical protein FWH28_05910 [Clostridiales bacterium]|nr:hypothetical protein [Clostridiales bacterium]
MSLFRRRFGFDRFKLTKTNQEKLKEINRFYFSAQQKLKGNERIDEAQVLDLLDKGIHIWNRIVDEAIEQYHAKDAIVFSTEKNRYQEYTTVIDDSSKNIHIIRFLSKTGMNYLIRKCFVYFCNDHYEDTRQKPIIFASGEAETLDYASAFIRDNLKGFRDNTNTISFIGGPLMVCLNNGKINGFVDDLLSDHFQTATRTLYRNKLMPFFRMYAGYFHCYTVGDNIMAESPHEFDSFDSPRIWYVFNSEGIAKDWKDYIEKYCKAFAVQLPENTREKAKEHFVVYNPNTQPIDRGLFLRTLEVRDSSKAAG